MELNHAEDWKGGYWTVRLKAEGEKVDRRKAEMTASRVECLGWCAKGAWEGGLIIRDRRAAKS